MKHKTLFTAITVLLLAVCLVAAGGCARRTPAETADSAGPAPTTDPAADTTLTDAGLDSDNTSDPATQNTDDTTPTADPAADQTLTDAGPGPDNTSDPATQNTDDTTPDADSIAQSTDQITTGADPASHGTGSTPSPDGTGTSAGDDPLQPHDESGFYISEITDEIFSRISGLSYPDGCTLSTDDLRYVHVLHYDFDGGIADGEIIVNAAVAEDVLEIFRELFDIRYPIERMTLIDEYGADDELSMEDNNTSSFNYRFVAGTTVLSNHALGLAIDINPLYNPYIYERADGSVFLQPYNAEEYVDREKDNPYYIRRNDECYNIFISHGFTWGGDWNTKKDYQHFEKSLD